MSFQGAGAGFSLRRAVATLGDVTEPLFEEVEHTADLAIVVRGRDQSDVFARAGRALYALMVDPQGVETRERRTVAVRGGDADELMHEWLSRLLELFGRDGFVAREIRVLQVSARRVRGELRGEIFQRDRHIYVREIKAVTFHGLQVAPVSNGWEAHVTFDV